MDTRHYFKSVLTKLSCVLILLVYPASSFCSDCNVDEVMNLVIKERSLIKQHKILQEAISACPENVVINLKYAYSCERLRKYDEALKHYTISSKLDKFNAKARFGMGDIYMIKGNVEAAVQAYSEGLVRKPDDNRALKSLGLAKIKLKAQQGSDITTEEFVKVMQEEKKKVGGKESVIGPVLRMRITFHHNSDSLTKEALKKLKIVGEALQNEALKGSRFEISGHTDDLGDSDYNMQLSKRRALSVKYHLVKTCRIPNDRISVTYFGETRPIVPNSSVKNRSRNRRVEFRRL